MSFESKIKTIEWAENVSRMIDQRILPKEFKLVDIKIHKTDKVYFMNFSHLGVDRKDGDDMFEQIWFIFENGFKLELTTDYCDYTEFSELPRYVRVG